jgi:hypothetical protein
MCVCVHTRGCTELYLRLCTQLCLLIHSAHVRWGLSWSILLHPSAVLARGVWCTRHPSQALERRTSSPSRGTRVAPCVLEPPWRRYAPPRLRQARGSPAHARAQGSSDAGSAPPTPSHSSGRGPRTPVRPRPSPPPVENPASLAVY